MANTPSTESVLKVAHYLIGCAANGTPGTGTTTANFGQVQPKPPKAAVDEVVTFLQSVSTEQLSTNS